MSLPSVVDIYHYVYTVERQIYNSVHCTEDAQLRFHFSYSLHVFLLIFFVGVVVSLSYLFL